MKTILWLISIVLMALYSYSVNGKSITLYELFIDFGDERFSHEIFTDKKLCEKKAKRISLDDKVKAYCVRREN